MYYPMKTNILTHKEIFGRLKLKYGTHQQAASAIGVSYRHYLRLKKGLGGVNSFALDKLKEKAMRLNEPPPFSFTIRRKRIRTQKYRIRPDWTGSESE